MEDKPNAEGGPGSFKLRSAKLDAMLAAIKTGVVLKRTKSGKMTVENTKEKEKRTAGGRSSDPALAALLRQSNADKVKWGAKPQPLEAYKGWVELAHVPLLQRQVCRHCNDVQVNVIAEMLHVTETIGMCKLEKGGYRPPVHAWVRRSTTNLLPHEPPLWQEDQTVAFCYLCLQETEGERGVKTLMHHHPEHGGQVVLVY